MGRTAELERLTAALQALRNGVPRIVTVDGDPGIGKTSLLSEIAERAGRPVLWGRATEYEQHMPFSIFADALEDRVTSLGPEPFRGLGAETSSLLRTVLPAFPSPAGLRPADLNDAERYRLHRAMRSLLAALAEPQGAVLVLDDLHWADEGSVEFVDYLLRRPVRAPLLLLMAYRPRQVGARLSRTLASAVSAGVVEHIALGPLTRPESDELLPSGLDAATRQELYEHSGGNPLYLLALSGDGRSREAGSRAAGASHETDVPAPVWAALTAELDALAPEPLLTARAAAVAGEGAGADLIAEVAGLPRARVLDALDVLAARDLVRPGRIGHRFSFRHPLVRRAAFESAGAGWRIAAHARAAASLRRVSAPATELAHHVEWSACTGDVSAAEVLRDAAQEALRTAPATAEHWLRAALRLLPNQDRDWPLRLELLFLQARASAGLGRLEECRDTLREVLTLLPDEPAERRAELVCFCAQIERSLGRHAEADALVRRERAGLRDGSVAAAVLDLAMATGQLFRKDFESDHDWAAKALTGVRPVGDPVLLATALGLRVLFGLEAEGAVGPHVQNWLDEAAELVDGMSDSELAGHPEASTWLGWGEIALQRTRDAIRHLKRGLDAVRTSGHSFLATQMHLALGTAHLMMGELGEADARFDDAAESALMTGSDELHRLALAHRCWVATWTGDLDGALRMGEQASSGAAPTERFGGMMAGKLLAQARLYAGDPAGFTELLLEAAGGPDLPKTERLLRSRSYELLALAESAQGHIEEAFAWAERADAAAAPLGLSRFTGFAQLARVHPLLHVDPVGAVLWAEAAAASFAAAGDRVETGRAHLFTGMAFAAAGEPEAARKAFAAARDLFTECGAGLFLEQTRREERRMNARMPRRSRRTPHVAADIRDRRSPSSVLTPRERRVAELAARGLTNQEIAGELYVSHKTVEVHLSRVYAKLGVARRAAVADRLREMSA